MYAGNFGLFENQYKAKSFTSPWQNTSCSATLISPLLKAKTRPLARSFHMMGNGVEAVDQWGVSGGDPRLTTSLAGPPPRPPTQHWKAGLLALNCYVHVLSPVPWPSMAEILPCSLCLCLCTQGLLDGCKSCCVSRGPAEPSGGNEVLPLVWRSTNKRSSSRPKWSTS